VALEGEGRVGFMEKNSSMIITQYKGECLPKADDKE